MMMETVKKRITTWRLSCCEF